MKEDFEVTKDKVEELKKEFKNLFKNREEIKAKFNAVKDQRVHKFKCFFKYIVDNIDLIFKVILIYS